MTVEEIAALPVKALAADNAHLHLWATNSFLREALGIMEEWGFEYKTNCVWVKPQMGIGNYWRGSHEILLFGVRGKLPFQNHSYKSWIQADRTQHSKKPECFRDAIEAVSPGPRLELFARTAAPRWVAWDNEVQQTRFRDALRSVCGDRNSMAA